MATEFGDPGLKRHAGPRRGPLEDQSHAAAGQHRGTVGSGLELGCAGEQRGQLGWCQFSAGEEMAGQAEQSTYARLVRVLTWNLLHGRSVPPSGRDLCGEFSELIASWPWDVALLQEVPPWWPGRLAERADAEARLVLSSRNSLLSLRRAIAVRWPDVIKSNGGSANAILVRGARIAEQRAERLGWWPERRWMHAVRLGDGTWVANLHANADAAQGVRAAEALTSWAEGAPVVLGGDFNVHEPALPGLSRAGGHGVDQVYVGGGLAGLGRSEVLDRGRLSDHAPVLVSVSAQV